MKRLCKWSGIVLGGLIGLILLSGMALYPIGMKKLTHSYPNIPVETVQIPSDPAAIARGRHIATIWAAPAVMAITWAGCSSPMTQSKAMFHYSE